MLVEEHRFSRDPICAVPDLVDDNANLARLRAQGFDHRFRQARDKPVLYRLFAPFDAVYRDDPKLTLLLNQTAAIDDERLAGDKSAHVAEKEGRRTD